MPIEQIFELRGPGPAGHICTPTIGCFHYKTIISQKNIRQDCYLLLKILQEAIYFTSPYLGQITYKI